MNQIYRYKLSSNDSLSIIDIILAHQNYHSNNSFYIYVDDRFTLDTVYNNKIKLLEEFGIFATKVIKYSDFDNILWIYLNRLIQLGEAYIADSCTNTNNDIKKIKLTSELRVMCRDMILFDNNIYHDTFYDIIIDDIERISSIAVIDEKLIGRVEIIGEALKLNKPLITIVDCVEKIKINKSKYDLSLADIDVKDILKLGITIDNLIDILNDKININDYIIKIHDFEQVEENISGVYIHNPIAIKLTEPKSISLWDKTICIDDECIYMEKTVINTVLSNKVKLKYAGCIKIEKDKAQNYVGHWEESKNKSKSKTVIHWLPQSAILLDDLNIAIYSKQILKDKINLLKINNSYYLFNGETNRINKIK